MGKYLWEVAAWKNVFGNQQINIIVEPDVTLVNIGIYSFGAYFQEPFHASIRNGE